MLWEGETLITFQTMSSQQELHVLLHKISLLIL